jgi:hypothetical protein
LLHPYSCQVSQAHGLCVTGLDHTSSQPVRHPNGLELHDNVESLANEFLLDLEVRLGARSRGTRSNLHCV